MKRAQVVIVGVGQWEKYTAPLIQSIKLNSRRSWITFVDNGIDIKRPYSEQPAFGVGEVSYVPINELVSYSEAINAGISRTYGSDVSDWIIIVNNDTLCVGDIEEYLKDLDPNTIYGNYIHTDTKQFVAPAPWLDGWIYAVPRKILDEVGQWDTNFRGAAFEDADFCWRASELGYKTEKTNLPFIHLEEHIRKSIGNYKEWRQGNIDYLVEKHGLKRTK